LCDHTDSAKILVKEYLDETRVNQFSFSSRKEPELMNYRMLICPNCDVAYANPLPNMDWLKHNYVEALFCARVESKFAAENHARLLDRIIDNLADLDSALDIGAGDGAFLEKLVERKFIKVKGVEPSLDPIRKASVEVRDSIIQGFFSGENFEADSYSLVTCFQTIEHVDEIKSLARSVYKILKPGGCFLISAHDYCSWTARLLGRRSPIYDIEHLQLFSKKSLQFFYADAEFTNIEIASMSNSYPLSYWLKLSPMPKRIKKVFGRTFESCGIDKASIPFRAGNLYAFGFKPS
jgi:2-polyprenyl-3-methyl-5-hydroxy-6-metoxy-1,4-benzoquinol methylase